MYKSVYVTEANAFPGKIFPADNIQCIALSEHLMLHIYVNYALFKLTSNQNCKQIAFLGQDTLYEFSVPFLKGRHLL